MDPFHTKASSFASHQRPHDNWTSLPRRSLCRMHSSLLISAPLLHSQQSAQTVKEKSSSPQPNLNAPGGLRRLESVSSDGQHVMVQQDHLTPDWYHLTPDYTTLFIFK